VTIHDEAGESPRIERRVDFGLIRYANCWEDADALVAALDVAPGSRLLSIASGGDNTFALIAAGAAVVAADLSPAQLAVVELKRAAFRRLEHEELLGFLGAADATDRPATYRRLRPDLPDDVRAFWDDHPGDLRRGIVHAGRFEGYFRLFRRRVLPLVHSRRRVAALLAEKTRDDRVAFYERTWNTLRWRLLFRVFFSRFVMGRLGRDPEFFRHVDGSVSARLLERTRYALTELPTHANPYLEYILTGRFERSLPRYLRPEHFDAIREGLDRLTLFGGPIEATVAADAGDGFDGFNLSDIFEYLDPGACAAIYARLLDTARDGARFVYWNMLVPRRRPDELANRVRSLDDLAAELFAADKAFFYRALVVEEAAACRGPAT
jgi:S-adenosylmethionine-diacylglycerol 3-amino-3-carboxypropyl transferase